MNDSDAPEQTDQQQQSDLPNGQVWHEEPPSLWGSKLASLVISGILYSALLVLVHVVGCQEMLRSPETDRLSLVKFVEPVPKTLDEEKHEGSDPTQKPDPEVAEFLPPIKPLEVTEIDRDEPEKISSGQSDEPKNLIATGVTGQVGTGIIGDRSRAGRQTGVRLRGGSGASENAVEAALRWLVAHQDDNGKWDPIHYTRHCPSDNRCQGVGSRRHGSLPGGAEIGVTGLAFLAFLGAGNTHIEGEHQATAAKALDWLLSIQNTRTGSFNAGGRRTSMYNQGIATLALAECYAMTKDAKLRVPLARAVGFLTQCQQRGGGWDYQDVRTRRSDTSVTGWVVMALKSARAAGMNIPTKTISGLQRHFDRVTNQNGHTGYTGPTRSATMGLNAVGMLSQLYLGGDRNDRLVRTQAALLLGDLPAWHKLTGRKNRSHNMYYWYYATLAMYQMGGREWAVWNGSLRDMLIRNQCTNGHRRGSWDPDGYWADVYAGRVYSTALCTLNLEVYYRYLPLHQRPGGLGIDVALAEEIKNETDPGKRVKLLRRMLSLSHPDVDATLKNLLNDSDPTVRFTSAKELAERGDPAAIPFLVQALNHKDDFVRFGAIRSLGRINSLKTIPPLIDALNDSLPGNAERAVEYLREKTGQNFGFKADFTRDDKTRIIASWKTWWLNNRQKLAAEPPVVARVLATRDGGAKVLVKLVSGGPLSTGMQLSIRRADKMAGFVRIEQVMEAGMAEGTTVKWMVRKPIRVNDQLKNSAALRKESDT